MALVATAEADAVTVEVATVADVSNSAGRLRVTWVRSGIGYSKRQKATIKALGLHRLHETVELPDNPSVRGQIFQVKHMLDVQES